MLIREVMLTSLQREPVHLREEALAEKHQVGRSVIRQSLGRLAGAGLIDHIPRRGWLVHPIHEEDLVAYLEVREVLELKALDLARPRIKAADLVPMLEGNAAVAEGQSPRLDNRLHEYLIAQSGNRYIQNFFRQYTATYYTSAFDYAAPEAHVVAEMAAQHRAILEALIARKWACAREALPNMSAPSGRASLDSVEYHRSAIPLNPGLDPAASQGAILPTVLKVTSIQLGYGAESLRFLTIGRPAHVRRTSSANPVRAPSRNSNHWKAEKCQVPGNGAPPLFICVSWRNCRPQKPDSASACLRSWGTLRRQGHTLYSP